MTAPGAIWEKNGFLRDNRPRCNGMKSIGVSKPYVIRLASIMLSFRGAFRLNQIFPRRRKARSTKELRRITAFPEVRQKTSQHCSRPIGAIFS
jgi:hypothetical protein